MNTATDYDNRSPEEVIAYLEARVEALTKRVQELEHENLSFCDVMTKARDALNALFPIPGTTVLTCELEEEKKRSTVLAARLNDLEHLLECPAARGLGYCDVCKRHFIDVEAQ